MSVKLIDFVRLIFNEYDSVKIFDEEDNLLFIGSKDQAMKTFEKNQMFAVRKILYFYSVDDILIITIK